MNGPTRVGPTPVLPLNPPSSIPPMLPPGMVIPADDDEALDQQEFEPAPTQATPVPPMAIPRRPAPKPPTPSIVARFPSGSEFPLEAFTDQDLRLPILGERVSHKLPKEYLAAGFTVPAGTTIQLVIAAVGIARYIEATSQWVFLVEAGGQLIWISLASPSPSGTYTWAPYVAQSGGPA